MKRILALGLGITMMFSGIVASAYSTTDFKNGDIDTNGRVSISDATEIQKYLANMTDFTNTQKVISDVNSDGEINIMDVTKIQKALVDLDNLGDEVKEVETPVLKSEIDIHFTNKLNWQNVHFYLYNSTTLQEEKSWPGVKIDEFTLNETKRKVYHHNVDVEKYDRIIFNNGVDYQTVNIPLTKASSGFEISGGSKNSMLVNNYAYKPGKGKMTKTSLTYSAGYEKKIWIWTPSDYNPQNPEKYKTIYMTDGQNLFDDHRDGHGGWNVTGAIESMILNGGKGVIVVGIDNGNSKRDSELTPDIGDVISKYKNGYENGTGETFSKFVVNTVMPYVQANYNSSDKAEDNIIAGSSSGGIEAFYIGMENMDVFGGIGALSPAFMLFNTSTWNDYFTKYDFSLDKLPKIYIFNGKNDSLELELHQGAIDMYNNLLSKGYDKEKITFMCEDGYSHNESFWRIVFPDTVDWILN